MARGWWRGRGIRWRQWRVATLARRPGLYRKQQGGEIHDCQSSLWNFYSFRSGPLALSRPRPRFFPFRSCKVGRDFSISFFFFLFFFVLFFVFLQSSRIERKMNKHTRRRSISTEAEEIPFPQSLRLAETKERKKHNTRGGGGGVVAGLVLSLRWATGRERGNFSEIRAARKKRQRQGRNLSVLIRCRDRGIEGGAVSLPLAPKHIPLHASFFRPSPLWLSSPPSSECPATPIAFSTSSISN